MNDYVLAHMGKDRIKEAHRQAAGDRVWAQQARIKRNRSRKPWIIEIVQSLVSVVKNRPANAQG